jgi:SNF2 family DNA or RNA helicase
MNLRPYQEEDAKILASKPCMACFNEQRTGKTPTALATVKLKGLEDQKILIVTTASTIYQWTKEYERWLGKPCVACAGLKPQKLKAIEKWTHGLVISIDSFKTTASSDGLIKPILERHPAMIILDEAHRIKSPKSLNAKALFKTNKIPHRLALTATPAAGKPYDVFSILKFLEPDKWTSFWNFQNEYFERKVEKITRFYNGIRTLAEYSTFEGFLPGKDIELQETLEQISIQRKRKDVMPWLPDKFYERVPLKPTVEQARYLAELNKTFTTEHIDANGVLARIVKYRQICLDPGLLDLLGGSPKTTYILQYLQDYPEESIIVFSKFTSYLIKLYNQLENLCRCGIIIGDTPAKTRDKIVTDFQRGKCKVLLINIDAGKEGLTLDTAETTIFTDKYPPIGDIQQAEDRFIASTEDKAHKAHKIIELVMKDTFDEHLYNLLDQRKDETDIINDYNKYINERRKRK